MKSHEFDTTLGGKNIKVQFNDLAVHAHGSCMISCENTVILVTAVMSEQQKKDIDFVPLSVEYEEKYYASGQILGSRYVRREGRPSEGAILSGRIVDRTIRPLFDSNLRNEVQVIITVLALGDTDPDYLAVLGASLALGTSHIPWNGPVSAVRINSCNKKSIVNPYIHEQKDSNTDFELFVCGIDSHISMIEFGGKEIPEDTIKNTLKNAQKEIDNLCKFQEKIIKKIGKTKITLDSQVFPSTYDSLWKETILPILTKIPKDEGDDFINSIKKIWLHEVSNKNDALLTQSTAQAYFEKKIEEIVLELAFKDSTRIDGRKLDEIRPIFAQAGGISPVLHGTGIFYRGKTHTISVVTLGGPKESQIIDEIEISTEKHYMHHYNFPPYSTGSVGKIGGINRRMVGHGALAEKALIPVLPKAENFPYTIRVVSEAVSSNGSTSMASVCGSTLALMDAGVPISSPVAGISIGCLINSSHEYRLLTDIQGPEDHYGDMDFKVAGTRSGITAIQLDIKTSGISHDILNDALKAAQKARIHILDTIHSVIEKPRAEIAESAPKILSAEISQDKIGLVIGPSGKTIKNILAQSGALAIDIEDDGRVLITGKNGSAEKALHIVHEMTRVYAVGEQFEGDVVKILKFGVLVRIGPKTDGMVHISELAPFRINAISDYINIGDRVPVIIKEIDERKRINLSIKMIHPDFFTQKHE